MNHEMQLRSPIDGLSIVSDTVRKIVARTTRQSVIHDEYSLAGDLYLDSFEKAELFMAVELALRIDFLESETMVIETVEDLIGLVLWKTRSVGLSSKSEKSTHTHQPTPTPQSNETMRAAGAGR